jgi:hypothetical integral membrane protein (TIGR02206 family)
VRHFSAEHIAALIATALAAVLLAAAARRSREGIALAIARGLALLIAAAFVAEQVTYAARGTWSVRINLPLQLTDAVTLVSIVALWRPRAGLAAELVYFWAFSATLQALLTPDLRQSFPDLLYFTYFATHGGALAAACLLVVGLGHRPRPGAVRRVYAATAAFACLAALGTVLTGGNYMFLRRKPVGGSLLDVMGPWPWYILAAAAVALVMFLVLDALARPARPPCADGGAGG